MKKNITTPEEKASGLKVEIDTKTDVITRFKKIKCNMPGCNRMFWTELDNRNIPYRRRCPVCNDRIKQAPTYNKYSTSKEARRYE